jgi:hypothetical protein
MKSANQVKHSKYKNTGILFELLVRQITLEILNGSDNPKAKNIVAKYFGKNTQLQKELKLYEFLLKEKYNSEPRAEKFVDTILEAYGKLDYQKLSKEKYNLVKEIRDNFNIDEFLSYPISNYKVMASIYKLFESKVKPEYDIKDIFNSKITIIENIVSNPAILADKKDQLIESYKKQEKDLRLLTYKILVENFNKKYTNLDTAQKNLLKEYINNVSNTSKFKDYILAETPKIVTELKSIHKKVDDKVTKIKLSETINTLNKLKIGKAVSDNHVSALMMSYELIKELKSKLK